MRRALLVTIAMLATVLAPLSSLAAAADAYEVYELEVMVPVRDVTGTSEQLATIRVEVERAARRVPGGEAVVLTYSPYTNIASATDGQTANGDAWTGKGYARAVADVIGTRGSTGCWDYGGPAEQASGAAVVEFLAGNRNEKLDGSGAWIEWSNGNVGMIGGSYDGTTATMVAATGTPGLKAIVPEVAISRWYGYAYENGVRYFLNSFSPTNEGFDTPLAFDFGFGRTAEPFDARRDPEALARQAIARAAECGSVEHTVEAYSRNPDYSQFWLDRDYIHDVSKYRASVLITHGWQDFNVKQRQAIDLWEALQANDDIPMKLLWMHQGTHSSASDGNVGQVIDEFFAVNLRGVSLDEAPALKTLVEETPVHTVTSTFEGRSALGKPGVGGTFKEAAWPPVGTEDVTLHLARKFDYDQAGTPQSGLIGSTGETGLITPTQIDSPHGHVWTWVDTGHASEIVAERDPLNEPGHGYYSLYYASGPLAADTRVAGSITVDAWVRPTVGAGAHLTPVVFDVAPDGTALVVGRGFMNLDYRDGLGEAKPAGNGEWVNAVVDLLPQDHTFAAGHRIALLMMSSNTIWAVPGNSAGLINMAAGPVEDVTETGTVLRLPIVDGPADAAALFSEIPTFDAAARSETSTSIDAAPTTAITSLVAAEAMGLTEVPTAPAVRGGARIE